MSIAPTLRAVLLTAMSVLFASPTVAQDAPAGEGEGLEKEIERRGQRLPEVVVEGTMWSGLPVVPIGEPRSHDVLTPELPESSSVSSP